MNRLPIINTYSDDAKERLVTLLLILSLIIEVVFLLHDMPYFSNFFPRAAQTPHSGEKIAQLITYKNDVRHHSQTEIVWNNTITNQDLYSMDSILTMDRSSAEIAFLDGNGIILGESSLILVQLNPNRDTNERRIVVRLLKGTIKKKSIANPLIAQHALKLDIQVGDTIAHVTPETEIRTSFDPSSQESPKFQLEKGTADIQSSKEIFHALPGDVVSFKNARPFVSRFDSLVKKPSKTKARSMPKQRKAKRKPSSTHVQKRSLPPPPPMKLFPAKIRRLE